MTRFGKLAAVALAAAYIAGAAPAGSDDDPSSYAVRVPVAAAAGSPVQRLAIPAEVLAAAQTADLSDLRVFDAAGKPMPIARIAPAAQPFRRENLPVLPILGAVDALTVTGVSLRLDGEGRARVAQVVGTPAGAATSKTLGILLDSRRIVGAAYSLVLDADVPDSQPVTFAVEASADLKDWRPIAEKVVYRVAAPGPGGAAALPLGHATLRGDYLRVTWRGGSRLLSPVTVRRATLVKRDDTAVTGTMINATAPPLTDAHTVEFAPPFALAVAAIQIVPTGSEIIVPVRILGRDDREQPWTLLGDGTAARPGKGRAAGGIVLGGRAYAMLRIEADPRSAGFTATPSIRFDFARREIIFLATGKSPYLLAAGRAAATAAYLPPASLMTQATDEKIATATAIAENTIVRLEPVRRSGGARQAMLWSILIGATALLGAMAWLLWRRSDAVK